METRVYQLKNTNDVPTMPGVHHVTEQLPGMYTAHGPIVVRGRYRYHPTVATLYSSEVKGQYVCTGPSKVLNGIGPESPLSWVIVPRWSMWSCDGTYFDESVQDEVPFIARKMNLPKQGEVPTEQTPWRIGNMTITSATAVLPSGREIDTKETAHSINKEHI